MKSRVTIVLVVLLVVMVLSAALAANTTAAAPKHKMMAKAPAAKPAAPAAKASSKTAAAPSRTGAAPKTAKSGAHKATAVKKAHHGFRAVHVKGGKQHTAAATTKEKPKAK